MNVLQQRACLVVNPITVGNFAFPLIARQWIGLQTLWRFRLKDLSIDEMVGAWYFGCLSGPPGFTCWISFAPVFSFFTVESLSLLHLLVLSWFICSGRWCIDTLLVFHANIYVSWSTSELRVRLAPLNRFKPSSKIFYWPFQGSTSFKDLLCFFCLVFAMHLWASVYMCLVVTCWGKGWPFGSCLWCPTVSLSLSHWYPGSGVVLDCIDSWSLHPYLPILIKITF